MFLPAKETLEPGLHEIVEFMGELQIKRIGDSAAPPEQVYGAGLDDLVATGTWALTKEEWAAQERAHPEE